MTIYLDDGKKLADASAKTIKLPKADQYQLQGEAFSRAVRGKEKLAFGVDDAILQMRVIDALFRSEKSGPGRSRSFLRGVLGTGPIRGQPQLILNTAAKPPIFGWFRVPRRGPGGSFGRFQEDRRNDANFRVFQPAAARLR